MFRNVFLNLVLVLWGGNLFSQQPEPQIIISTPGYTSIYRYTRADFPEGLKHDLRIDGRVALHQDDFGRRGEKVYVTIGQKQFNFWITPNTPYMRLLYDRNKRTYSGIGCNFEDLPGARYTPPAHKGTSLSDLGKQLAEPVNRAIHDRTLLDPDQPTVFILEAEIDEQGRVHRVQEINGALRQYARTVVDTFHEQAGRDWEPAKRDGIPFRSLAQIRIEISR